MRYLLAVIFLCGGVAEAHSIEADILYWLPIQRTYDFASINVGQNQKKYTATASYHPGGRIKARYDGDCYFAQLSYLYLRTIDTAQINTNVDIVLMTQVPVGLRRVRAELRHRYQNIDLRIGKHLYKGGKQDYYLFVSGRWVRLDYREESTGAAELITVNFVQRIAFEGGGLGVGFGTVHHLPCNFSLFAEVSPQGIIGERKQPLQRATINGVESFIMMPIQVGIIPAVDFSLGIDYQCGCVSARIGYELNYYWEPIAYIPFTGGAIISIASSCFNQAYGGPYARLAVNF